MSEEKPRRRWFRPRYSLATLFLFVVTLGCDPSVRFAEKITDQEQLPRPLRELLQDAEQRQVSAPENLSVYRISHDEYFWTCDTLPEFFELMSDRWKLSAVSEDHDMVGRFFERMPPALSSRRDAHEIDYFLSKNWLEGRKGDLFCVMNDKTTKTLTIRYYFNF